MAERIFQEWYCTKSGGGCGGYIVCKINIAINGIVEMVCPNCGHKHQRVIEDGIIKEQGRHSGKPTQEICPTKAAWSKKARLVSMQKNAGTHNERDGVVPKSDNDFLQESWREKFGGVFG
jgi:hypothetical protein